VRFALAARYIHPDLVFHPLRTDHCFDYLAWGVVLAIVLSDPIHRESLRRRLNLGVRFGILAAFIALIYGPIPLRPSLFSMVIPLCLACTMLRTEGTLSKLLELAPVRWVGRISYSLYLWHQLFLVDSHGSVQESPLALVQWFPVNVLLAFGLAAASYYFVESPLRAWGYRWLDGRTWAQRKGVTCPPANSST
jgi:peptidoglycan/LPS O-acetylase OafA/YrhL